MCFNNRIEGCLEIIQIGEIIDFTATMPVRCILEGGLNAIVKYQKNPEGLEVLIDEWIGNSLADLIGLTIPRYGLCNLTSDVIEETNRNYEIDTRNAGIAFFSEYVNNSAPVNRKALKNAENKETEKLLLFDHLINNEDRHEGNLIYKVSKSPKIIFIDCSHFMTIKGHFLNRDLNMTKELSEQKILDAKLLSDKNKDIYDLLCVTQGYDEDTLWSECRRIKQVVSNDRLKKIQLSIPDEWKTVHTEKRIRDIFTILQRRIFLIERITEMIAEERRRAR